jgi:isopentenyl diphosphate isomerase/L-lactate dehydrogenase-like FMN-dependent dehydrogenase
MGSLLKVLVATMAAALALAAAADSASAASVYRGANPTLSTRIGAVNKSPSYWWNVYRYRGASAALVGRVVQVGAAAFYAYRRTTALDQPFAGTFVGYAKPSVLPNSWTIHPAGTNTAPIGRIDLGQNNRWSVYKAAARVGTVNPVLGGPAAGAALLLLM